MSSVNPRPATLAALLTGALLACPDTLPAQARGTPFAEVAVGVSSTSASSSNDSIGPSLAFGVGRTLGARGAVRIDAELQFFGPGRPEVIWTAPCPLVNGECEYVYPRVGPVTTASALASFELYERTDRKGFYLLAGLGPQLIAQHPDRARAVRLAAQAGGGLSLGAGVRIEVRYQATVGALGEPRHVTLVTLGVRGARVERRIATDSLRIAR